MTKSPSCSPAGIPAKASRATLSSPISVLSPALSPRPRIKVPWIETVKMSLLYADRGETRHPGGIRARRRGLIEGGRRFTDGGAVERAQALGLACVLGLGLLPKTGAPVTWPEGAEGR